MSSQKKVMSVVGARPQFIKLAVMSNSIKSNESFDHLIVDTGQHYDYSLSQAIFDDLEIPKPNVNLQVGSSSHVSQTAKIMLQLEHVVADLRPDILLLYGDTNSTLAGAIVGAKMNIPMVHLEAGVRSANMSMPEEVNRIITDRVSNLLLAPTLTAMANLRREGLSSQSKYVGDVMIELCFSAKSKLAPERPIEVRKVVGGKNYLVSTIHRPYNTDSPDRLRLLFNILGSLGREVILVAHPRLQARILEYGIEVQNFGSIKLLSPLRYTSMIASLAHSDGLITDSGGLQKEAYILGIKCTTVRNESEWPETFDNDWNVLVKELTDLKRLVDRPKPLLHNLDLLGPRNASQLAWQEILKIL